MRRDGFEEVACGVCISRVLNRIIGYDTLIMYYNSNPKTDTMMDHKRVDHGVTWYFPHMHNLRFMRAQYVQHAFKPHAHDYFVLGLIETGVQSFTYQGERLVTTPGSVIVINPEEVHTGEAAVAHGFAYRALYPSTRLMERITCEFCPPSSSVPKLNGGIIHDPQLFRWIQKLHHLSENPTTLLELDDALIRFFVTLIYHHAYGSFPLKKYYQAHYAVHQVRDYLEAHYAENVTLSDLSALVHISSYHLSRLFCRHFRMPPHTYLENVRVRHAERMLVSGMPIADVAFATGFSSQSHLTRTFKRIIGTTPGAFTQYRKIV